ncbi:hypothetical protein pb186bvf_012853 [Paramecium bursaria]
MKIYVNDIYEFDIQFIQELFQINRTEEHYLKLQKPLF